MSDRVASPSGTGHDTAKLGRGVSRPAGERSDSRSDAASSEIGTEALSRPAALTSKATVSAAVPPAEPPESEFQPDSLKSGGQISGAPVVSPADTIRRLLDVVQDFLRVEYPRGTGHPADAEADRLMAALIRARTAFPALLAVGERDRQRIAQLTEALEQIGRLEPENQPRRLSALARSARCFTIARDIARRAVLADEEDAEPERQVAEGYATGMRESRPNVCWRLLDGGDWCCILDRGHDGGIHEPGRAAGEGDT